jgi:hypothetical protein
MIDVSQREANKSVKQAMFSTYKEVGLKFIEVMAYKTEAEKHAVMTFANYLDEKNTIGGNDINMLAIQKSREIEKEILTALIEHIGVQKSQELMLPIVQKHRHTSNAKKK